MEAGVKIAVAGDIERPISNQEDNVRWLYALVAAQLEALTGTPPEMLLLKRRVSYEEWLELYATPEGSCWLEELPERPDLLIGFELPERTKWWLRSKSIPFIDVIAHPWRFMDDLVLGLQMSQVALQPAPVSLVLAKLQANLIASQMFRKRFDGYPEGTAVIFGQTKIDRSLMRGGKMLDLPMFKDALDEVLRKHPAVLYKPHPHRAPDHNDQLAYMGATVTQTNAYKLLSHPSITHAYGISSSCLYEAQVFGKTATFWGRDWADGYTPVSAQTFLSMGFWKSVVRQFRVPLMCSEFDLAPLQSRLRRAAGAYWGFDEVEKGWL